jgi:hypothetical protein
LLFQLSSPGRTAFAFVISTLSPRGFPAFESLLHSLVLNSNFLKYIIPKAIAARGLTKKNYFAMIELVGRIAGIAQW